MIRISTFERAKERQNYQPPMQRDGCQNCAHVSHLSTRQCMLGGFYTMASGICDKHERRVSAPPADAVVGA